MELIIKFIILTIFVSGVIIFFLHRALISSTEGAVQRLNQEIAKANDKQAELSKRLKEADEELAKRRAEAKQLADKMRSDAEEESKAERDKIINGARKEGEEIIAKAQGAKEKIRAELEKEFDIRLVNISVDILNDILSQKSKGALDQVLTQEFIENLKVVDMSKISPEVKGADVITLTPLLDEHKKQIESVIKEKLGRDVAIKATTDEKIGGGAILKFGSLALDGSIKSLIREAGLKCVEKIEVEAKA